MFAVIESGGKQYVVSPGKKLKVEKLDAAEGANLVLDKVMLTAEGDNVRVGTPYVDGARVEARVLKNSRHKKVIVFKYHSKTRYRKKKGHRQHYTEIEIIKLS